MKRFLSVIVLAVFFAAGLFAEQKVTEEQIESFLEKGTYIKISYPADNECRYFYKQNIAKILIEKKWNVIILFNINDEKVATIQLKDKLTLDEHNNIILVID